VKKVFIAFIKGVSGLIIAIAVLLLAISILLQISFVQNMVAGKATAILSEKTGTRFDIGNINISFFDRVQCSKVYIEDYSGDTMIYADNVDVTIKGISPLSKEIILGRVSLSNGNLNIRKGKDRITNLKKVFEKLKPKEPRKFDIGVNAKNLHLENISVKMIDSLGIPTPKTVNFKDLSARNINIDIDDIDIRKDEMSCRIRNISFQEKSGFTLSSICSDKITFTGKEFNICNLSLGVDNSQICFGRISASYDSISAIKSNLNLNVEIAENSQVALKCLDYFLKKKLGLSQIVTIGGEIKGDLNKLQSNLDIESCGNNIDAFLEVNNIRDRNNASFFLDLKKLHTNSRSITEVTKGLTIKPISEQLLNLLARLGDIDLSGKFEGKTKNFQVNALIATECGKVSLEGYMHPSDSAMHMSGNVKTNRFHLGKALNVKKLGTVRLSTDTEAKISMNKGIIANGQINLDSLYYGSYMFHDIIADGKIDNGTFTGNISCSKDPNFRFSAVGNCDFIHDSLPSYNFRMNLSNADFAALGVNKRDSISRLTARFSANFMGNDIDNISGFSRIDSIYYINQIDTIESSAINLIARNNENEKFFELTSGFADVELKGKSSYKNLIPYFKQLTKTYIPSFDEVNEIVSSYEKSAKKTKSKIEGPVYTDGFYSLKLTAKESNRFASIFIPGIEIAKGSSVNFYFNPKENRFTLNANSDYISLGKTFIDSFALESHNNKDSLLLIFNAHTIDAGKFCFTGAGFKSYIHNNSVFLKAFFSDTVNMANIELRGDIRSSGTGKKFISMKILPSRIKIDTSLWNIRNNGIILDSSRISIDSLRFSSGIQDILIAGNAGKSREDTLNISIRDLDIAPASIITKPAGYNISAITNGNVSMVSILKERIIKGKLKLNDIVFTGEELGDCEIESTYDNQKNRLLIDLSIDDGTKPVTGFYSLSDRVLDLDVRMPKLRLCLLAPILKGTLIDMTGTANTDINFKLIKGIYPVLNGKATIDDFYTTVNFTKCRYHVSGPIDVKDNRISGNNLIVYDMDGNSANLSGYFYSYDFRTLKYSMDVTSDRIIGLNTTKEDNDIFFGKVYCNGNINISGNERKTLLKAEAWTSHGSVFNMPFSSVATNSPDNFITFRDSIHNPRPTLTQIKKRKFFNKNTRAKYSAEFEADLTIHATPDVQANLEYSNTVVNNLIQGSGNGRLDIFINTTNDIFTMNGGLDINSGTYRLIFSIADKTFYLKRGSTIKWRGDPTEPIVDLTGIYQVHTSLQPLMGYNRSSASTSAAINCGIRLSGLFFSPTISFEITAPNATPETQSVLRNALNTEEALATQFFYLFLTNSFSSENTSGNMQNMGTSFVSTTGFEFLSSQISSLLSTKNFSWRPTYKPRTEQNSDEFGMETQFNLLSNRMTLNFEGRYFLNPKYSSRQSPFSGGGNISYNLNRAGNISLKAFTRVIDRFDETQGLQESGMGVYFTQEFNDWEDLKKRMRNIMEKKKKKNK